MQKFYRITYFKKTLGKLLVFQVLCKTNISGILLKHLLQSSSYFCFENMFRWEKDKIPNWTKQMGHCRNWNRQQMFFQHFLKLDCGHKDNIYEKFNQE